MTRKVVTRAPHREVGIVNAGWLLDHPVQHESHLERRFIIAALSCPVVCDIQHQPFTLQLSEASSTRKYTPDFLITFRDSTSLVVEVKPRTYIKRHEARLRAAEQMLQYQGQRFFLATDAFIDGKDLSARAMLLMRYGRMHCSEIQVQETLNGLQRAGRNIVSVQQLVEEGLSEDMVWCLVARHLCHVSSDFEINLTQAITITPYAGDCHDYFQSWFGAAHR
ncbi:Tn7 transposase TnsA N-terminal domain-containing protein [Comamonas testosteroni]|uniref:Tn7 transposase TnsA N-terminal domain-containing protein n=1 Tax=Comamonas testosteroni TaxID=285 RepID=UPI002E137EB2|nr:Tn7 transposase TnsA N-terminal domain-containing protein [Comamonas testosteroni]